MIGHCDQLIPILQVKSALNPKISASHDVNNFLNVLSIEKFHFLGFLTAYIVCRPPRCTPFLKQSPSLFKCTLILTDVSCTPFLRDIKAIVFRIKFKSIHSRWPLIILLIKDLELILFYVLSVFLQIKHLSQKSII